MLNPTIVEVCKDTIDWKAEATTDIHIDSYSTTNDLHEQTHAWIHILKTHRFPSFPSSKKQKINKTTHQVYKLFQISVSAQWYLSCLYQCFTQKLVDTLEVTATVDRSAIHSANSQLGLNHSLWESNSPFPHSFYCVHTHFDCFLLSLFLQN